MENKKLAIYQLGNMRLIGFIKKVGDGRNFWFNTEKRVKENKMDLLVAATDLEIIN